MNKNLITKTKSVNLCSLLEYPVKQRLLQYNTNNIKKLKIKLIN